MSRRGTFARAGLSLSVVESGSGRRMIFQHGLCGDAAQPQELFPGDAGWSCLTLECRGHGASEAGPPEAFSIATFADDVAALAKARGGGPVVIGGVSMGAAIALRLAVQRPDLVSGLVLVRPAWFVDSAPANMAPNAEVGNLLANHELDKARALFEASPTAAMLAREAPDNLASLRGFFTRAPIETTAALLRAIAPDGPGVTRDALAGIAVPTVVIGHGEDFIHPIAHAEALAAAIPKATLVRITPKAVSRERYVHEARAALSDFLKEIPQ
ncbi:alpha/beta hydrolase [Kaistia geumhonensis]|uniref:Pimeloyl-ACP methyl ester carboxylesterase n=1 Tax=Kaistia geumhonensis TaxID=410839 RepID=A0ABU0M1B8_9HYPH|nr:alpha/beta hydrolase [Kaistia geumhonensis]MCX5480025.1 alpha/beta hydrolase [Kaistia geumhonensis]MDQ0514747.1 pimeloyl-ACP methyl ester carboxylesterase [Kaistia geumhonensis]